MKTQKTNNKAPLKPTNKNTKKKKDKPAAAGDKKKSGKKDAQFMIRIDRETRDQFTEICNEIDTSAAREVRKFMKRFIRRYENGELDDM